MEAVPPESDAAPLQAEPEELHLQGQDAARETKLLAALQGERVARARERREARAAREGREVRAAISASRDRSAVRVANVSKVIPEHGVRASISIQRDRSAVRVTSVAKADPEPDHALDYASAYRSVMSTAMSSISVPAGGDAAAEAFGSGRV